MYTGCHAFTGRRLHRRRRRRRRDRFIFGQYRDRVPMYDDVHCRMSSRRTRCVSEFRVRSNSEVSANHIFKTRATVRPFPFPRRPFAAAGTVSLGGTRPPGPTDTIYILHIANIYMARIWILSIPVTERRLSSIILYIFIHSLSSILL